MEIAVKKYLPEHVSYYPKAEFHGKCPCGEEAELIETLKFPMWKYRCIECEMIIIVRQISKSQFVITETYNL